MKLIQVLILLALSTSLPAQQAPEDDLNFMIGKIRSAYAGYADKISPPEFERLITRMRQSASGDSLYWLSTLTGYFRDDHLAVFQSFKLTNADTIESRTNLDQIDRALHRPGHPANTGEVSEGYWLDDLGNCIIYIRRISPERWEGDIVATKDKVPAGLRVLTLEKKAAGQWLAGYIDADVGYRVITPARLKEPGVLIGGCYFKFRKCTNYEPGMLAAKKSFSYLPSIDRPDSETLVIRMPYFEGSYAKLYDSLIRANSTALSRVSILILDIRNNPGGSVRCYAPLAPYICTGPLHRINGYQLCSKELIDDARETLQYYEQKKDSGHAAQYRDYIDTLEHFRDTFKLFVGGETPCQPASNSIRHVAIVMDHGSRSAAELMVLYFRQSAKVRLFGENTTGAVDYLDLLTFTLPHSHFQFWVASSKRQITTQDPAYDGSGIPPDTLIPEAEPDWINFVRNYYRAEDKH